MDLALDLMKCVSYDILEEFGFEPAPCEDYRKSEKHLTRIAEEESADDGLMKSGKGHSKRVVIIRVDHRIRWVESVLHNNALLGNFSSITFCKPR